MVGFVLLILTLLLESIPVFVRYSIATVLVHLALQNAHQAEQVGLVIALAPIMWALLPLTGMPSGATRLRRRWHARRPTEAEHRWVMHHLRHFAHEHGARLPHRWFVVDQPHAFATTLGTTLYLYRGVIGWQYGAAILAHELGHLHTMDARLVVVVNRLTQPFGARTWTTAARTSRWFGGSMAIFAALNAAPLTGCVLAPVMMVLAVIAHVAAGGWGARLLRPAWDWYRRQREYRADRFAARLG